MLRSSSAFWFFFPILLAVVSLSEKQAFAESVYDSNCQIISAPDMTGWLYRKEIVMNSNEIETDLNDFPFLLDIVDPNLTQVESLDSEDILFFGFNNVLLDSEIEYYDPCSGRLIAWINIPCFSSTEDNIIYMFCGDRITQGLSRPEETWDSNYIVVQHFNENAVNNTSGHFDSTCNLNDGVPKYFGDFGDSNTGAVGKIGRADSFGDNGDYINFGHVNFFSEGTKLWEKFQSNPLIEGRFGSMWYNGPNDLHAYYGKYSSLYYSTSSDGVNWVEDDVNNPILNPVTGFADCTMVWVEDANWFMLYRSNEWGNGVEIGLATSTDGINWIKSQHNPVISPSLGTWDDEGLPNWGIDPWGIIKVGTTYYLWYNTISVIPRRTGLITSTDLIYWQKDPNNPIFDNNRFCVFPFKYGEYYYMLVPYFPGHEWNDIRPWDHQIELYRDLNPTFYEQDREFLGAILASGRMNQWDQGYLDTPSVLTLDIYRDSFPDDKIWMYYTGREKNMGPWREGLAIGDLNDLSKMKPVEKNDIDAMTIESWIKLYSTESDMAFISNDQGYEIGLRDTELYWSLGGTEPNGWCFNKTGYVPSTDQWYHICFTYDSNLDHNNVNFYINGQSIYTDDEIGTIAGNSNSLFVGSANSQGTFDFNGVIDELRISKIARSSKRLQASFANQNNPQSFYSSGTNKLILEPYQDSLYVKPGEPIIIHMDIKDLSRKVNGCQAMLGFDSGYLRALPGCVVPGGGVWDELIYSSWDIGQGIPGEIDTAIGVWANGHIGTDSDGTVALITLAADSNEGLTNLEFRPDDPNDDTKITILSDIDQKPLFPWKIDSQPITIDGTPPVIDDLSITAIGDYTAAIEANTFDVLAGLASSPAIDINGLSCLTAELIDDQGPIYRWLVYMDANTLEDVYTIKITSVDLAGNTASESVDIVLPFCIVNFNDYARFARQWLDVGVGLNGDLDHNGRVDANDLDLFTEQWLNVCPQDWKLK